MLGADLLAWCVFVCVVQYADMGTETEFGCLQCRVQMKGSRGPGVTPLINMVMAREVASSTPPAFVAHVGDIR